MQFMPRPACGAPLGLPPDTLPWAMAALVALIVSVPLDLSQLVFVGLGAAAYYIFQLSHPLPRRPVRGKTPPSPAACRCSTPCAPPQAAAPAKPRPPAAPAAPSARRAPQRPAAPWALRVGKSCRSDSSCKSAAVPADCTPVLSVSVKPISTPVFCSVDFDAQVVELVNQITPTAQTDRLVKDLARSVATGVREVLPEVEVTGVASGTAIGGGTAFGVAVPEVDIVVNISPSALAKRVQVGSSPSAAYDPKAAKAEARRVQKVATRICTDRLVASGYFKFRRSAFRAHEPKVTLVSVAAAEDMGVPFDLSVNCATPLCNAALLEECGQMEPRARSLILLVRRWAKDRGVCHAAKGHLPPYAWTLLVIYFLQVGVPSEGPLLPPLQDFAQASGLLRGAGRRARRAAAVVARKPPAHGAARMSVGTLFRGFVDFYGTQVDWRREAVAVHRGHRAAPELAAELHLVIHDNQEVEVAPTIQDPFEPRRNVATTITAAGLARLHEELARARDLCACGAALAELLEPWSPEASLSGSA